MANFVVLQANYANLTESAQSHRIEVEIVAADQKLEEEK